MQNNLLGESSINANRNNWLVLLQFFLFLLEPTFRVPSALELTPEKFHDFLPLASSPSLLGGGSPELVATPTTQQSNPAVEEDVAQVVGTPSAPSFAQVGM